MADERIIPEIENAGVARVGQSQKPDRWNLGVAVVFVVPIGAVKQTEKRVVVHLQDGPAAGRRDRNVLRGDVALRILHDPRLLRIEAHVRQVQPAPRSVDHKQSAQRGIAADIAAGHHPVIRLVNTARPADGNLPGDPGVAQTAFDRKPEQLESPPSALSSRPRRRKKETESWTCTRARRECTPFPCW